MSAALRGGVIAYGDSTAVGYRGQRSLVRDANLSFGFAEVKDTYKQTRTLTLVNKRAEDVTLTGAVVPNNDAIPGEVTLDQPSVTIPALGTAKVKVTMSVKASDIPGSLADGRDYARFYDVSGAIRFEGDHEYEKITVPYLMVPRAMSEVQAAGAMDSQDVGCVDLTNSSGVPAEAAVFNWAQSDPSGDLGGADHGSDITEVGVASFQQDGQTMVSFAIHVDRRYSNTAENLVGVRIDTDMNGEFEGSVVALDSGLASSGEFNGVALTVTMTSYGIVRLTPYVATAPTDSGTVVITMPVVDIPGYNGKFWFSGFSRSYTMSPSTIDEVDSTAVFDPERPPLRAADTVTVSGGDVASLAFDVDRAAFDDQGMLGYLTTVFDNAAPDEVLTGEVPFAAAPTPRPTPPTEPMPPSPTPSPSVTPTSPVPTLSPSPTSAPRPMNPCPSPKPKPSPTARAKPCGG